MDHGKVEAQGRLKIILLVWRHAYEGLSNGNGAQSELTGKQKVLTGIKQGEKSPLGQNRDAMTRDYITTCSGQNEKSSLLAVWILPATGDNDIKYKLVFKLFKSGNCTWFACPTEELLSKFWAVGFFLLLLLFEH